MLMGADGEIIGHADIQSAVTAAGHDVDRVAAASLHCSLPPLWIPAYAGMTWEREKMSSPRKRGSRRWRARTARFLITPTYKAPLRWIPACAGMTLERRTNRPHLFQPVRLAQRRKNPGP